MQVVGVDEQTKCTCSPAVQRRSPLLTRKSRERGSALLIVFVFAAIIAIMLYREMPVTVFEAKRQKEQLLIDRGHEYTRAVQLFYRKNRGQYPSSIEQLESTNNLRFLRKRYTDPFTGKDDWRLLHAGPGGMLIDSKVPQQAIPGATGQPATNGQTGSWGQNSPGSSSSLSSSSSSSSKSSSGPASWSDLNSSSSSSDGAVVVSQIPQRPPAIAANSGNAAAQTPTSQTLDQNPDAPLLPPSTSDTSQGNVGSAGNRNSSNANGSSQGPGVMQTLSPVLGNATTPPSQSGFGASQSGSGNGLGQLSGGGALAGVASKATGRTIKVINDQDDYSLWEFYYNPATDTTGRMALGGTVPTTGQTGAPGVALPNGTGTNSNSSTGATAASGGSTSSSTSGNIGADGQVNLPPPTVPNQPPPE